MNNCSWSTYLLTQRTPLENSKKGSTIGSDLFFHLSAVEVLVVMARLKQDRHAAWRCLSVHLQEQLANPCTRSTLASFHSFIDVILHSNLQTSNDENRRFYHLVAPGGVSPRVLRSIIARVGAHVAERLLSLLVGRWAVPLLVRRLPVPLA